MRQIIFIFSFLFLLFVGAQSQAYGHGLGFEILPPIMLGDKEVSLEVSSSLRDNPENPEREITFSLFQTSDGVSIREVTYHITAFKGNEFLFEDTFESDNGIFIMDFFYSDSKQITITKQNQGGFIGELVGIKQDVYVISGSQFNSGGLYNFVVEIVTAESYSNKLSPTVTFFVGLSIPDKTVFYVDDPNFGSQELSIITYYDQVENIRYQSDKKELSFEMPFDWSINNINETSVIHEEFTFPKSFGDLLTASYFVSVNGLELPDRVLTIDDFTSDKRIVHLVLNQNDLKDLFAKQKPSNKMNFLIKPNTEIISTVTENGQFRIDLNWKPRNIKSDSNVNFLFNVSDVFLKDKPVSVPFDLTIVHGENTIYSESGITTDSKTDQNEISVFIPKGISGPITLKFENLDGNTLAQVAIPVVVDRKESQIAIPEWVRKNAGWWSAGQISDKEFANGIEFLMKKEIIRVPISGNVEAESEISIPDWLRNNAEWWSKGQINDKEFANGIEFLVTKGIIVV
ncbi:MAG: peptidase [Nitrosopumilus sp.]|nr:peptidase [Nitrosopumilus sp.]NNL53471.1 peptidase [Nitrosopumilus sp.]